MKAVSLFIGVIFFFCVAAPLAAAASYTITDLGLPDGPYVASYAQGISNSGVVMGWAENGGGEHHAFVWENDSMTSLGTLGGDESEALHINDLEQIAGWAETAGGNAHAFSWEGDTMTDLGTLGGPISRAFGISASGQVAGYSNIAGSSDYHACLWDGDTVTDLGTLGGPWSKAYGMNDIGQIVGKSDTGETAIDLHGIEQNIVLACLWEGDTVIELSTLGGLFSQANHINNLGQVVGSSYLATGNNTHAFIWENGAMTDLGTLGGNASEAYGINDFGQAVGFSDGSAFIWENGTMTDLNDSITPGSGWTLIEAYDIDNAGQIVGWGINSSGQERAFLLTPTEYDVYPGASIQEAIDAASEGDTVVVAPGVYYENINFKGKNIVLTSFDPFDPGIVEKTIIDGSRPDNPDSGSVVTFNGSETTTCVLTGFTIQNGSGTLNGTSHCGGGIYCNGASPKISYCTIYGNLVGGGTFPRGGGLFFLDCTNVVMTNCTISDNFGRGGGISLYNSNLTLTDSILTGNSSDVGPGGINSEAGSKLLLRDCTITGNEGHGGHPGGISSGSIAMYNCVVSGNSGEHAAGGISCGGDSIIISNCVINGNRGTRRNGGGISCGGNVLIENCVIENNSSSKNGGGISCSGNTTIKNCSISNNWAAESGGGIECHDTTTISDCVISGNYSTYRGGGINDGYGSNYSVIDRCVISGNSIFEGGGGGVDGIDGVISNCLITGNYGRDGGGLANCPADIINCIIADNLIRFSADGPGLYNCTGTITNSIIWNNIGLAGISQLYECDTPTYSCIQDWTGGGEGNISSDPMFVGNPYDRGTWTADAVYDTSTFRSTLIDSSAAWETDTLAGMLVQPDTATVYQYYIVSNTDTTIMVFGEVSLTHSDTSHIGNTYAIYDYHLDENSPCIDSGYMFADAGEYDLDKNPRYMDASNSTGWDGTIKGMFYNSDDTLHIAWKLIDMGAHEYQSGDDYYDSFTLQACDALDTGQWQKMYSGTSGCWSDTGILGLGERFYRILAE